MSLSQPSALVKNTINQLLALAQEHTLPWALPSEHALTQTLAVSRSTLRAAIHHCHDLKLIAGTGRQRTFIKKPLQHHYYQQHNVPAGKSQEFELFFLQKITDDDLVPGQWFSERELSIESNIHTIHVREALARFARYGFIQKEPRHRWQMVSYDNDMADELFDVREMIELHAVSTICKKNINTQEKAILGTLLKRHLKLAQQRKPSMETFRELDKEFHKYILRACGNRYLQDMFASIALIIHFQLRHIPSAQYGMNAGIDEHTQVLKALLAGNAQQARQAMRQHVNTSRSVMKKIIASSANP